MQPRQSDGTGSEAGSETGSETGSGADRPDGSDGMMEPTGYGGTMDAPDMRHEGRGELQENAGNQFRYILVRY